MTKPAKCSCFTIYGPFSEDIAERLAGLFEKKALGGTGGVIVVKTENWNSQDGITHRNEKSQIWEGTRPAWHAPLKQP